MNQVLGTDDPVRQATRALILVPTRELSEQVAAFLRGLLVYCDAEIVTSNVSSGTTTHLQRCAGFYAVNFGASVLMFSFSFFQDTVGG